MSRPELLSQVTPACFRVLSLDGGGAKGFYTLGILEELEALLGGKPLYEKFHLVFGTSTGAIIAALIVLGRTTSEIHTLYKKHVPTVTQSKLPKKNPPRSRNWLTRSSLPKRSKT